MSTNDSSIPSSQRQRRRQTFRPKSLAETSRHMEKLMRTLGPSLAKKVATYPGGEFVLIFQADSQNRRSQAISKKVVLFGTDAMKARVMPLMRQILAEVVPVDDNKDDEAPEPVEVEAEVEDLRKHTVMPRNAEIRAVLVREFLAYAWKLHVGNIPGGKKQMYRLVKEKKAEPFGWWESVVPGVAFDALSVTIPEVSEKLFAYLGARILKHKTEGQWEVQGPPPPPPPPPAQPCSRHAYCTSHEHHPGACRIRPPALEGEAMDTDDQVTPA